MLSGTSFVQHFRDLKDPRVPRAQRHVRLDILIIALLATLTGADGWEDMEDFARAREAWLRERLGLTLENRTPSDDTFRRVFAALDPEGFQRCFEDFTSALAHETEGKTVCVDGKTLRHSFDTASGQKPVHIVRAWASENRLVLGAVATEARSNEIPAGRALLALLDLKGALVTADAEHTQNDTAEQIRSQGDDYLLSLKRNHPHLYEDVALRIENLAVHPASAREWREQVPGRRVSTWSEADAGHGRTDARNCGARRSCNWLPRTRSGAMFSRRGQTCGVWCAWSDNAAPRCLVRVERQRRSSVSGTPSRGTV